MPERINIIKLKCVDHRFGLGYKTKGEDYKQVAQARKEARMAKIEGRESKEEELVLLPLQVSFRSSVEEIKSGITDLHIGTLECQGEEADLPHISIHDADEPPARTFVQKLAGEKTHQNWKMEPAPIVFKKNYFCLIMSMF